MKNRRLKSPVLISLTLVALFASPAYANMGLPMIAVMWPLMILALLPIIAVESYVIWSRLSLSAGHAAAVTTVANAVSTIVGTPVAWFLMLLTPLTRRAAWHLPFNEENEGQYDWVVPTSALVLLVPFFFASWFIEYRIAVHMLPWLEPGTIGAAAFTCNLITYGCLAAFILGASIWAIRRERQARSGTETSNAQVEAQEHDYESRGVRELEVPHVSETMV
jgi:hypothetical protein